MRWWKNIINEHTWQTALFFNFLDYKEIQSNIQIQTLSLTYVYEHICIYVLILYMCKYILISLKTIPFEKSNIDSFVYNLSDMFFYTDWSRWSILWLYWFEKLHDWKKLPVLELEMVQK